MTTSITIKTSEKKVAVNTTQQSEAENIVSYTHTQEIMQPNSEKTFYIYGHGNLSVNEVSDAVAVAAQASF